MTVHVFSIMWNEEYMLPYFLRHYSTFAERIFIFNDNSTDKTAEIAAASDKVTLLDYEYDRGLHEDDHSDCFEKAYKKYSRGVADWVFCVDGDELIYHEDMPGVLRSQREQGARVLKTRGYQMVSKVLPETDGQLYEVCGTGSRSRGYDKTVVFDPALDLKFGIGRHTTQLPEGVNAVWAKLLLLHYRYLSREFVIERATSSYPRWFEMSQEVQDYRLKRALDWYDKVIKNPQELEEVV